ncbi:MAG: hypothetical protein OEV42_07305 [Deltaproteobacteria bacterium]|nr:hypothetical protein [Deltaproteobacteria bacterium]
MDKKVKVEKEVKSKSTVVTDLSKVAEKAGIGVKSKKSAQRGLREIECQN